MYRYGPCEGSYNRDLTRVIYTLNRTFKNEAWEEQNRRDISRAFKRTPSFHRLLGYVGLSYNSPCWAHAIANVVEMLFAFLQNAGRYKYTYKLRAGSAELFPELFDRDAEPQQQPLPPWVADKDAVFFFESELLMRVKMPHDVGDGQLKSPFGNYKYSSNKRQHKRPTKAQQGRKMMHLHIYAGDVGAWLLQYTCPESPQRLLAIDILRLLQRVRAPQFSEEELVRIGRIAVRLQRRVSCVFPLHLHTITLHLLWHAEHHLRKYGPLHSNWTFKTERAIRALRDATPTQGRDILRMANAAHEAMRRSDAKLAVNPPEIPAWAHGDNIVNETRDSRWTPYSLDDREFKEACEMVPALGEAGVQYESVTCMTSLEINGQLFRTSSMERMKNIKHLHSVRYANFTDIRDESAVDISAAAVKVVQILAFIKVCIYLH